MKLLIKICILILISGCTNLVNNKANKPVAISRSTDAIAVASRISLPVMSKVVAGNRFYYVRLRIGDGPETNVILDTGSIGLRAISTVVPHRNQFGRTIVYSYESGNELHGSVSNERITAGEHQLGTIPIQVVDQLRCSAQVPNCTVAKLAPSTPFAQGIDGRSSQEFGGIMGIRLYSHDRLIPNPLRAAGFKGWIVQLPRPGEEQGALILNPSMAELKGFTRIKVDKNGSVPACLDSGNATQILCLPTVLDSGDPHVFIFERNVKNHVMSPGTLVKLSLFDGDRDDQKVVLKFTSAQNPGKESKELLHYNPALVSFKSLNRVYDTPFINSGYLPFLDYLIYFDAKDSVIGMQERKIANPSGQQTVAN